jgi:hypothetical protein
VKNSQVTDPAAVLVDFQVSDFAGFPATESKTLQFAPAVSGECTPVLPATREAISPHWSMSASPDSFSFKVIGIRRCS